MKYRTVKVHQTGLNWAKAGLCFFVGGFCLHSPTNWAVSEWVLCMHVSVPVKHRRPMRAE